MTELVASRLRASGLIALALLLGVSIYRIAILSPTPIYSLPSLAIENIPAP